MLLQSAQSLFRINHATNRIFLVWIDRDDLRFEGAPVLQDTMDELLTLDLPAATALLEKMLLQKALRESDSNRAEAARRLGIRRQFLYAKLKEHGL